MRDVKSGEPFGFCENPFCGRPASQRFARLDLTHFEFHTLRTSSYPNQWKKNIETVALLTGGLEASQRRNEVPFSRHGSAEFTSA